MLSAMGMRRILAMAWILVGSSGALAAEDGTWAVRKSSGEVWITAAGAQQASLSRDEILKPGDTIRTGRNGRLLLVRGEETILVSPNSVIGLPTEKKDGLSTTIMQQAGSILLEVEKRNVKHFEVETPYLAAVVKGTQFSVTVNAGSTRVDVQRGRVEVSDFKSGQIAQVMAGQAATSFAHGRPGLSLSGSGPFNPIEQGKPRASSIGRIPVPKDGLSAPHNGEGKTIHALAPIGEASGKVAGATAPSGSPGGIVPARANVVRLSTALGEVRLNVKKVTHGLAHGTEPGLVRNASRDSAKDTIWSDKASASALGQMGSGNSNVSSASNAASNGTSSASAATTTTTVAATAGAASDAGGGNNGNGNGATGNGNGNGNNGNGNNGNGNGGVGNGNGKGNAKH